MANGIRTGDPRGFNKRRRSKFREGSRVRQTPEEGRRTYRPKRYGNNNKDEDKSPKTLNDKNHKASFQKFRQLRSLNYAKERCSRFQQFGAYITERLHSEMANMLDCDIVVSQFEPNRILQAWGE